MGICTELWFGARARAYANQGIHLLVCPRATPVASTDKWIAGGITAAVVAGAFCVSSNFNGLNVEGIPFGGVGWVIQPEEGRVLGQTSQANPLVTIDIDPAWAEKAKQTYPRAMCVISVVSCTVYKGLKICHSQFISENDC